MKLYNIALIIAAFSLTFFISCSEEERKFVEFEDVEYGALPRALSGPDVAGNEDGDAFDYNNVAGSGVTAMVEMFDENNGQNIESYSWTVAYKEFGPVDLASYTKADFSPGVLGLPTLNIGWTMQELLDALSIPVDSLQFGFKFDLQATLTKTNGSVFTSANTSANIAGQPAYQGLYQMSISVDNVPILIQFKSDLAGIYDAVATSTSQAAGIGWDDCEGNAWEGTVEWVQEHTDPDGDGQYALFSVGPIGEKWEDASQGTYYSCYGTDSNGSLPLGDLRLLDIDGKLEWSGASQWGEVFSIDDLVVDGASLTFDWSNDYGEGGIVVLTRTDGTVWPDGLTF